MIIGFDEHDYIMDVRRILRLLKVDIIFEMVMRSIMICFKYITVR